MTTFIYRKLRNTAICKILYKMKYIENAGGNIQSKVRTQIHIPKNELQTERQWAKQGYVVDRPSAEHARGHQLWTNSFCNIKEKPTS